jgi:hypothetical protein
LRDRDDAVAHEQVADSAGDGLEDRQRVAVVAVAFVGGGMQERVVDGRLVGDGGPPRRQKPSDRGSPGRGSMSLHRWRHRPRGTTV